MKPSKTIFAFLLLIAALPTMAQISPLVGLNYSNLRVGWDEDQKQKFGLRAGVQIQARHLVLHTVYTTKGVMQNRNVDPATGAFAHDRWSFNMNYLQQSVFYNVGKGWFNVRAGGYAAYLIDAKQFNTFWGVYKRYKRDDFRKMDYGAIGEASIDLHGAYLVFGYEKGLRTIADPGKPHGDGVNHHAYKNDAFTLSLAVPITSARRDRFYHASIN